MAFGIEHPVTKVHPRLSFWGALVMQWWGAAMITFSILGWSAYVTRLKKAGKVRPSNAARDESHPT